MSWQLLLILPNLPLTAKNPFENDFVCICSAADTRMQDLTDTPADATGLQMARAFRDWFGRSYTPSCLLVRQDAPQVFRDAEVLRAFRNVCSLATTTYTTARLLEGGQWLPAYSDFFFFASHVPARNGWIQNLHAMVSGMNDEVGRFAGQCAGQIDSPDGFSTDRDPVLLRRLIKAWDSHFIRRPTDEGLLPLFRSLEIAFQANRFPSDGLSSINDVGTRIGLWVSAFEVLFHPGPSRRVNKRVVQTALETVMLSDPRLRQRRYSCTWGRPPQTFAISFPAFVYDEMYRARNSFMHGNQVSAADLQFRRSRRYPPLWKLAPVLYNIALRAFTKSMFPWSEDDRRDDVFFGLGDIESALLNARGGARDD